MTVRKPIWCKCHKSSWTRRQLLAAWENAQPITCDEPTCGRQIDVAAIQQLLEGIGVLKLEDISQPELDTNGLED